MTMLDQMNSTPTPQKRLPWNKGKLTEAKPPLRPKHVWSIRTKLQIDGVAAGNGIGHAPMIPPFCPDVKPLPIGAKAARISAIA
jgi:hypothetical protein